MPTNNEKLAFSKKIREPLTALNELLAEADRLDMPVGVFTRSNDPVTGRRTIIYVSLFKHGGFEIPNGGIAQEAERRAHNSKVGGSSPPPATK